MRPSARAKQQIWAISTDGERSVPVPPLKHTAATTLKKHHDIGSGQGPRLAPVTARVQVVWAQGRDLDLDLRAFFIFYPDTLSRGP